MTREVRETQDDGPRSRLARPRGPIVRLRDPWEDDEDLFQAFIDGQYASD